MDLYARAVKQLFYPLTIAKNRSKTLRYWKEYEESQWYSPETLSNLRWTRLSSLLKHAYKNCPFYRARFKNIGMSPDDIQRLDDLGFLPALTKDDIQEHLSDMLARDYDVGSLIKDRTGGSTGKPIEFWYDLEREDRRQAFRLRFNSWAHWEIGDKVASIWGTRGDFDEVPHLRTWLRKYILRSPISLDASHMSEENMYDFVLKLRDFRPKIISGYTKSLSLFAKYLIEEGIFDIRPKSVICSAEVLSSKDRTMIQSAFECEVFNKYGCREVGPIASECRHHDGLHVNDESIFLEIVRNGKAVHREERGEILITDLCNYVMPLIRYKIGDVGILLEKQCLCGRGLSMIGKVEGRTTDYITLPDGRIISGPIALPLITDIPGLRQAQIIQHRLDLIELRIVRDANFTNRSHDTLFNNAVRFFGPKVHIEINYTGGITKEESGKFRFTISKLRSPF